MWKVYTLLTITMLLWGLNFPGLKYMLTHMRPVTMTALRVLTAGIVVFHPGSLHDRPTSPKKNGSTYSAEPHLTSSSTITPQHGPLPDIRHERQPHPWNRPSTNSNLYITHPAQLPDQNPTARRNRRLHRHRLRRPRRRRLSIRPQTRRRFHLLLHPGTSPFVFSNR